MNWLRAKESLEEPGKAKSISRQGAKGAKKTTGFYFANLCGFASLRLGVRLFCFSREGY